MANSFVRYTGNGSTTAYSISYTYRDAADLIVSVNGVATTAYSLNAAGTTLTFDSAPASSSAIEIRRKTSQTTRLTDYAAGSVLTENDLDTDSTQAFFMGQEAIDDANDVIKISSTDFQFNAINKQIRNVANPTSNQDVATKHYLENTFLTTANKTALTTINANIANIIAVNNNSTNINSAVSNATNINTVATNIGSVNTVAADIAKVIEVANDLQEAVSEVETVADDLNEATSEIDTVATSITNVDTVGNNIANVNTVAGISANVTTVAGNNSNVSTVAGISSDVTAVAGISSDVQAVENIKANVTTVAGISSAVSNVSGIASAVSAVNSNSSNINAVNSNSANINTVASNNSNISTVAGVSSDVTTVAGIASDVSAVENIASNVTTVAGMSTAINTVNSNATNVNAVGGAIANVNLVGGSIANVNTVAGIDGNVTTVAGISSDVTAVAGISTAVSNVNSNSTNINAVNSNSANINAVAGDATDIGAVATNIASVNTVAGISGNVTTVANDATDIGTVATNIVNVNNVGGSITNVNNVGSNIAGVNAFAERYRVASSDPTSSLDAGDLAFNTSGNVLKYYDGSSWQGITAGGITDIVQDGTPQLGGDLDVNGNQIVSTSNGNIVIMPNGSGNVGIGVTPSSTSASGATIKGLVIGGNNATGVFTGLQILNRVENATTSNGIAIDFDHKVSGSTTIPLARVIAKPSSSTSGDLQFYTSSSSSLSERMRLTSTGLGIGVSSPSRKLQVVQDSTSAGGIYLYSNAVHTGTDTNALLAVRSDSNNGSNNGDVVNIQGDGVGDLLVLNNNGTDRFIVQADGNVGIGTSAPTVPLMVQSNETQPLLLKGANDKQMVVETTGGSTQITSYQLKNSAYAWQIENGRSANTFTIRSSGGGERVRIDASGNFGISTSAPKEKLDSRGSAVFSGDHATATNAYGTAHGILLSSTSNLGKITAISNGSNDVKLELRGLDGGSANANQLVLDGGTSNVGIGETSPFANVHVKVSDSGVTSLNSAASGLFIESANSTGMTIASGTSNVGRLVFADSGANLIGYVQYDHANNSMSFQTQGAERLRISSSGSVGIGTTNPTSISNLHVADTYANEPMIRMETSDSGNKRLDLYISSGQGYVSATQSAQSLNFASRDSLIFKTDTSNERMRIDSSGRLLIGTTDIGYSGFGDDLTIGSASGNNGMTLRSGTSNYGTFYFSDDTGTSAGTYAGKIQYNHSNNSMVFATNSASERMRIDSSGSVGIGNTVPGDFNSQARNLVIGGGSGDTGMTIYSGSGSGDTGNIFFADGTSGSDPVRGGITYNHGDNSMNFRTNDGANRIYISSAGSVGIATSSPSEKLEVNGNVKATAFQGDGSALTGMSSGGMTLLSSTNLANITGATVYRIAVNLTGYNIMYISLGRIATNSTGVMPDFKLGFNNDSTGSNYMFYRKNADNAQNKGDLSHDSDQFFMNGSGFAGFTPDSAQAIFVYAPANTDRFKTMSFTSMGVQHGTSGGLKLFGGGQYRSNSAITECTFTSAQTLNHGVIDIYGIK